MYQNPQINVNAFNNGVIYIPQDEHFGIYSNDLQQPSSNILRNDVNAACNYTSSFASDDVPMNPSNEAQYHCNEHVSIQNLPPVMNISYPLPSLPVNSPSMTFNPPQAHPETYRFEIPGFQIIIIPISSSQYQPRRDHTFLNPSLYTHSVSSSQLNQEQNHFSSASGTSSAGGSSINIHNNHSINIHNNQSRIITDNLQHRHQQQNSLGFNETFGNFSNNTWL